jgi:hypothetical protein
MTKHDSKDEERFTISEDKYGEWLVFDNQDFYCCYSTPNRHDAISEAIKLNGNEKQSKLINKEINSCCKDWVEVNEYQQKELVELRKKNAELEQLVAEAYYEGHTDYEERGPKANKCWDKSNAKFDLKQLKGVTHERV